MIKEQEVEDAVTWLQQHNFGTWCSWKAKHKHPAFIYNSNGEIVDINFSKVHGKDRRFLKLHFKRLKRKYLKQYELFNSFCGKNVLYVHARQGGGNRSWCQMDEIARHPHWLGDVDDAWDSTYCDIYFDLSGLNIDYDNIGIGYRDEEN